MTRPSVTILGGDCLDHLPTLPDNSVDSVICDPPYGLSAATPQQVADTITAWATGDRTAAPTGKGFMGKSWDAFVPPPAVWDECLRVLKPGGHMLVFAGSRTQDLMGLSIRLAGFDIRDGIGWIYGSGFPKSMDVGKAIDKRGGNPDLAQQIAAAIKAARTSRGWTTGRADKHFCGGTTNWTWFEGRKGECRPPTPETFARIVAVWPELAEWAGKVAEAEREVTQEGVGVHRPGDTIKFDQRSSTDRERRDIPATPEAERWAGWGTALKPSHEPLVVAQKPHGISGILSGIGSELSRLEDECRPSVNGVARSSAPTPVDSPEETTDTAPASAATPHEAGPGPATGTGAAVGSSAQMDTSWSDGAAPTAWSTVSSWRTCWVELCELTSTSITSTMTEATTDLRTLWSSISSLTVTNMPDSLTQALTSGSTASAVDNLFAATVLSLRATHALSVTESATESTPTSRQAETGQEENRIEPILLARKPLDGTVAANVLEWGTGALNIDASRVAHDRQSADWVAKWSGHNGHPKGMFGGGIGTQFGGSPAGRWPANVLLDPEAAAAMDEQSGVSKSSSATRRNTAEAHNKTASMGKSSGDWETRGHADSGGASRFFPVFKYQAKAPKKERPVIEREDGTKVQHPTVKPLSLMEWLVTLITPPGGVVLDPFAGSGTTLQAARDKGFRSIGVEADADHVALIRERLEQGSGEPDLFTCGSDG